jgi:hypothetical protein
MYPLLLWSAVRKTKNNNTGIQLTRAAKTADLSHMSQSKSPYCPSAKQKNYLLLSAKALCRHESSDADERARAYTHSTPPTPPAAPAPCRRYVHNTFIYVVLANARPPATAAMPATQGATALHRAPRAALLAVLAACGCATVPLLLFQSQTKMH